MTSERWVVSDVDDYDQSTAGRPLPSLVSLHFVRSALRRRWWACVLFALLGLLIAIAYLLTSSTSHVAKAALVMAHDPQVDSSRAMSTDVSLLTTRAVANKTIASLGLDTTPDEFLQSVTADPVSSDLLSLTLTGPSSAEAVRRLDTLTSTYLSFRAEQLSAQSNLLVDGMRQRIQELQDEMAQRSKEIDRLANASNKGGTKLSDAIAQRAYVQEQIETLQQSIQDATLRNASVVASSRVVDPAAVDTAGIKRRIALTLASGLIGGAAVGCGIVLFFAITSDRLRRRSDVAAALEAPLVSVGRIAPVSKRWVWLPQLHKLDRHRADERQRLARAIEMELSTPRRTGQLAMACIDNADEVRFAVATAAADLVGSGCTVALIDLSERGRLVEVVPLVADPAGSLTVLRPRGLPALAAGPDDLTAVGHKDGSSLSLELNDVTLVFAELDPSVGVDHLATWTERVIVAVTAGRSSAERVRTVAELIRTAGLDLRCAALLHTERTDDSSAASFDRRAAVRRGDGRTVVEREGNGQLATRAQPVAAAEQPAAEEKAAAVVEPAAEERSVAQPATEEQVPAVEEQGEKGTSSEELEAIREQALAEEEAPQQQPTEEHVATVEEQPPPAEKLAAAEKPEPVAQEQVVAAVEPAAVEPAAVEPAAVEQVIADEQSIAHAQAKVARMDAVAEAAADKQAIEGQSAEEQEVGEEQPAEARSADEETAFVQSVPDALPVAVVPVAGVAAAAADPYAIDEQPAEEPAAAEELAAQEEAVAEEAASSEQAAADEQGTVDERHPAAEEEAAEEPEPIAVEPATVGPAAEGRSAEEEIASEQVLAGEQLVPDGQLALVQVAAIAVSAAEQTIEEQPGEETVAAEETLAVEEPLVVGKPSAEEPDVAEEQAARETATDMQPLPDELQVAVAQVAAAEQRAIDNQPAEERPVDEPVVVGEQIPNEKRQATAEGQPGPAEQLAVEEQLAAVEHTAEELEAIDEQRVEEQSAEQAVEEEIDLEDQAATADEQAPEEQPTDEQAATAEQATDEEQTAEPDYVPDAREEGTVYRWNLYITRYPPADGAPALESEDGEFDWRWDWHDLEHLDSQEDSTAMKADFEADGHESGNGSAHRTNAEGDGRVVAKESARNGKKPTIVARTRTKSRTRRRSWHK